MIVNPSTAPSPNANAPAQVDREDSLVEEEERCGRAAGRADPVRPVDDQVDAASNSCWYELVDRGVDGRVFAADAGAGEEAGQVEEPGSERECRGDGRRDVDREGQDEKLLAPEPVGHLPEEQRAHARPDHIDRSGDADLAGGDRYSRPGFGQPAGDGTDDGDFETVKDPHRTEPDDHEPVKPRPREAIEPRRNPGLDFAGLYAHPSRISGEPERNPRLKQFFCIMQRASQCNDCLSRARAPYDLHVRGKHLAVVMPARLRRGGAEVLPHRRSSSPVRAGLRPGRPRRPRSARPLIGLLPLRLWRYAGRLRRPR